MKYILMLIAVLMLISCSPSIDPQTTIWVAPFEQAGLHLVLKRTIAARVGIGRKIVEKPVEILGKRVSSKRWEISPDDPVNYQTIYIMRADDEKGEINGMLIRCANNEEALHKQDMLLKILTGNNGQYEVLVNKHWVMSMFTNYPRENARLKQRIKMVFEAKSSLILIIDLNGLIGQIQNIW